VHPVDIGRQLSHFGQSVLWFFLLPFLLSTLAQILAVTRPPVGSWPDVLLGCGAIGRRLLVFVTLFCPRALISHCTTWSKEQGELGQSVNLTGPEQNRTQLKTVQFISSSSLGGLMKMKICVIVLSLHIEQVEGDSGRIQHFLLLKKHTN